jgi:exonuclease SbcD
VLGVKFLHTSDWHVGRMFHGHDLLPDQEAALTALAELARDEQVDGVLLSGDIYDRAIPSAEAVGVATRALQRIRDAGAQIVAIAGNHDSAARLGAFSGFLAAGGLHLRTGVDALDRPVVFARAGEQVAVYGIPYLEPDLARHSLGLAGPTSHHAIVGAAMDRVRADLASRPRCRSVVLAHAFVVGAAVSGSERSIAVGGVESVGADVFDGIDYVALGHLHTAQRVSERLRYSGSVLPYSFTEAGAEKGVWLVEVPESGPVRVDWLALPVVRPVATVRGTMTDILMGDTDLVDHYLAVELTDPVRPIDPMRRLREAFPFALTVAWSPPQTSVPAGRFPTLSEDTSDRALLDRFLSECRGGAPSVGESALLDRAVTAGRADDVRAGASTG